MDKETQEAESKGLLVSGTYASRDLDLTKLTNDYRDLTHNLKVKLWEARNGERRLFIRSRSHEDNRHFDEICVSLNPFNEDKMARPWNYSCEDGCEHAGSGWFGSSIYGPNEEWWCNHPKNQSGSCKECPRAKMSSTELIQDLFESLSSHATAIHDIKAVIANVEDHERARFRGRHYEPDLFLTPAEVVEALKLKLDFFEHGEEICPNCGSSYPANRSHDCQKKEA